MYGVVYGDPEHCRLQFSCGHFPVSAFSSAICTSLHLHNNVCMRSYSCMGEAGGQVGPVGHWRGMQTKTHGLDALLRAKSGCGCDGGGKWVRRRVRERWERVRARSGVYRAGAGGKERVRSVHTREREGKSIGAITYCKSARNNNVADASRPSPS